MCLYSRIIKNRKYESNKKNGGEIPLPSDKRAMYVPVSCGECMECRKKKKRDWQIRLGEEVEYQNKIGGKGMWLTLTFSEEGLRKMLMHEECNGLSGYERENKAAKIAMRQFLGNWRKHNKKSVRHWFITELGHKNTERIHLHGFVWVEKEVKNAEEQIKRHWKHGNVWTGKETSRGKINQVTKKTVNYTIKYVHKVDEDHKYYKPIILCTGGIGGQYTRGNKVRNNKYNGEDTKDYYVSDTGNKIKLPTYYRNKIYTDEEREKMWMELLDKEIRYVGGIEIDISKGEEKYYKTLKWYQNKSKRLGYGSGEVNWERKNYENQRREMLLKERFGEEIIKREYIEPKGDNNKWTYTTGDDWNG